MALLPPPPIVQLSLVWVVSVVCLALGSHPHLPRGTLVRMNAADVRAYLARDWQAVADEKDRCWLEQRSRGGVSWAFDVAEALRREVIAVRPDWPLAEERAADIAAHERVSASLQRVRTDGSR